MATTKDMLSAIIRFGKLTKQEEVTFGDMWDSLHRFKSLSVKQAAWVEKVYLAQKLDKTENRVKPKKKVGFINDPSVTTPIRVESLLEFARAMPHVEKDSPLWKRVEAFLRTSDHVVELRPPKP